MSPEIYLTDIEEANRLLDIFRERNTHLERALQSASQRCTLRLDGLCDLDCLGRLLCDVHGLTPIQIQVGSPPDPSCLDPTD